MVVIMINIFRKELKAGFVKNGIGHYCEKLFCELGINNEYIGISYRDKSGNFPLEELSMVWARENDLPESVCKVILNIVGEICKKYSQYPYCIKPSWNTSPNLCWLFSFSKSYLFPYRLFQITHQIQDILSTLPDDRLPETGKIIAGMVNPLLRYSAKIDAPLAEKMKNSKSDQDLFLHICDLINLAPPPTNSTFKTYVCDISRLLIGKKYKKWVQGVSFLKKHHKVRIQDFIYDWDDQELEATDHILSPEEIDLLEIIKIGSVSTDSINYLPEKKKQKICDPLIMATKTQFCDTTPGVLKTIEVAILSRIIQNLEQRNLLYGAIAKILIFSRLFYGWSDDFIYNLLLGEDDEINYSINMQEVMIHVDIPVGYPKEVIEGLQSNKRIPEFQEYLKSFEKPSLGYSIPVHQILISALSLIRNQLVPIDQAVITEVWEIINKNLKRTNYPIKITPGILRLTFYGWAFSRGLDCADCYVVNGRILSAFVMPINYTYICVLDSIRKHWEWMNGLLLTIFEQDRMIISNQNGSCIPWLRSSNNPDLSNLIDIYAGSWSIPKIDHVKRLIKFLRVQIKNPLLDRYEKHNYLLTFVSICFCILTLSRPFEFELLDYFPNVDQLHDIISMRAKIKRGEITYVTRQIPEFLIPLFQECIETCKEGYLDGPIWFVWDENNKREPYVMQEKIDFCMRQIALGDFFLRAYGLRHLGRTLHRIFGLREYFINYKMNHDSLGREKYNPSNIGYSKFMTENNDVVYKIAKEMGII